MLCPVPDPSTGMAISISSHFDCLAKTLGREGFVAVASYLTSNGVITSLLVLSVALIGYQLILVGRLDLKLGVGWAARVGIILALLSGWTAFQTLFYDVAVGGPTLVAELLLSALGQSPEDSLATIQRSYDALRLGTLMSPDAFLEVTQSVGLQGNPQLPTANPDAANALLVSTVGLEGAIKLAVGFLLAIAPFPIAALLFSYSQGFFWGWLKALLAGFFAIAGIIFLNALHASSLAASVARVYDTGPASNSVLDDIQAIPVITSIFSLAAAALFVAILKTSNSLVVMTKSAVVEGRSDHVSSVPSVPASSDRPPIGTSSADSVKPQSEARENVRKIAIIDSLNDAVVRERRAKHSALEGAQPAHQSLSGQPPIIARRRGPRRRVLGRQHASLNQRDKR